MALTVNLSSEQAARLQAEADRSGLTLSEYVLRRLLGDATQARPEDSVRMVAIDAAMGALQDCGLSSEDFMHEKRVEIDDEERRWREGFGPQTA